MPLGTKVGVSPGDARGLCVRRGHTPPPSQKGGGAPNFRPMSIVGKRLDGSIGTWQEVGLFPVHIVLHEDTAPLPKMGQSP